MRLYPEQALWNEIAYLAYHLHWDMDGLLDLEHPDRARLVQLVADMNDRAWESLADAR
ncbi:MAG: hypothetical protein ACI89G_000400 [Minisyncoccia bacterium]